MPRTRKLRLVKENVAELASDELTHVVGGSGDGICGTDLCNPCIFTWSCDTLSIKYVC